ncbi:hypothetical protein N7448_006447 [Penicillium atrosanguineum]|uniref:DUF7136 domain-containing protein n=1 Tax=Penicillium atrosanguineum TaxID=1132637 RepID=A0A9W9L2J6_9EURO|nr:hypothetical protein N7448_006447 [Penicillium atrosanguineum]KAJ5137499.1 hypothetical protein N7526_003732 [Penicillium atrosanguineum]KAJ5307778.1 hypothetical protein N7476_008434 [Penicillium atrosanguineum]
MFGVQARLLALSLLALADADSTGVAEVNIVFPRNGTYGLMPLMPVYLVYPSEGPYNGSFSTLDINRLTANETTQFLYKAIPNILNVEWKWGFSWRLRTVNCSTSDIGTAYDDEHTVEDYDGFHRRAQLDFQSFQFTTTKGGRQPNLTTITTDNNCGNTQGVAFDVKQYLNVPSALTGDGLAMCALLASPAPTPSPCRASVVLSAASSISARLTQAECYAVTPAVSCLPKKDAAALLNPGIPGVLLVGLA